MIHNLRTDSMTNTLRLLIREMNSPVGDSTAEVLSDIDEVIQVLEGICEEVPPDARMKIKGGISLLKFSTNQDGRKIAAALSEILNLMRSKHADIAPGLILRLETLLRRSLPTPGTYDSPQSKLNPPFDPSKTGRYIT